MIICVNFSSFAYKSFLSGYMNREVYSVFVYLIYPRQRIIMCFIITGGASFDVCEIQENPHD